MSGHVDSAAQDRFATARALQQNGRVAEAEAAYRELLAAYPGHPALLASLALILKDRDAFGEAERLLRRAVLAAPREAALHNNLGNVLRKLDRPADAADCYRKAIALDRAYAEAPYNLGVVLEEMRRPDEALEAYRGAVALRPGYGAARVRIGSLLQARGDLQDAVVELEAARAAEPSFEAEYYLGLALLRLERHDEAIDTLTRALALRPASLETIVALANAHKNAGRNDQAIDWFWRAIEVQPFYAPAHNELNNLAAAAGRDDTFLKSFAYVRERHGDNPGLLATEAQIRLRRNETQEAEPLLQRALQIEPAHGAANVMLGRMLAERRQFDESFSRFAAATAAEPNVGAYRVEFGYALLQGGEAKLALREFETAQKANPFDQLALSGVCLALRALGDRRYFQLADTDALVRTYPLRVPAGYADAQAFNHALAEELSKLHTTVSAPLDQTLRGGTQTPGLLFTRPSKAIGEVRESIAAAVGDYVREMADDATHPFLSRKAPDFSFTHSWSCKLKSSGFHTNHVHPMGWISSAYYVSLPDALDDDVRKPGWLKFGESHLGLGGDDKPERYVRPAVGHLVLFPSYFWHGTVPFEASSDRLTIAFDAVPGRATSTAFGSQPY